MIFVVSHSSTVKNCFCVLAFIPYFYASLTQKKIKEKLMTKVAIWRITRVIYENREPSATVRSYFTYSASVYLKTTILP